MKIRNIKYRIFRRIVQIGILLLFFGSSYFGWNILNGNYSAALVLNSFHLADPYAVLQIFAAGVIVSEKAIIGALIIFGIYAIIFGRGFCTWVCPLNLISDLAFWIKRNLKIKDAIDSQILHRKTRNWILGLSLIISALSGMAAFELISPISILHREIIFGVGFGLTVIVGILLFDVFILQHGWCGYLCPLGAFYSLVSRYRLIKIKHKVSKCTNCLKCFDICPEGQVLKDIGKKSGRIHFGACNNCGRCIEVCDDLALKFSIK